MMETGAGNHFECGDQYDDVLCLGSVTDQEDVFEDCCTTTVHEAFDVYECSNTPEELHTAAKSLWDKCNKNPKHSCFYEVDNFSKDDLPVGFQDANIVNLIKDLAYLVVRVIVSQTSPNPSISFGSGRVWDVYKYGIENKRSCECLECKRSTSPVMSWGEVNFISAGHVLNVAKEGSCSISCWWNFNKENGSYVIFEDVEVSRVDLKEDLCRLRYVTHDLNLINKLQRKIGLFDENCDKVYKAYKDKDTDLVAVVSHPHGWYKQVTVGKCLRVMSKPGGGDSKYHYTAGTCSGSSGAPVYYLGRKELRWATNQHLECIERGFGKKEDRNASGYVFSSASND